jgi:hypothetical protein
MHFNWTISKNVTQFRGNIHFLVCVENSDGVEWHTELCSDLYISEGMDHAGFENEVKGNPDILTQLLELNKITLERAAVYVGSGEMPEWANVQIDPEGEDADIGLMPKSTGIHIGENEPTDDSEVWIDTDEELVPGGGGGSAEGAVLYTEQTLSEEQQLQARENIGAISNKNLSDAVDIALTRAKESGEFDGEDYVLTEEDKTEIAEMAADMVDTGGGGSAEGAVLYTEQTLTEEQKMQARTNIGAVSAEDVEAIINGETGPQFSETSDLVELAVEAETPLSVVSKIHRDSTWGPSNKLVLHQVSGCNFADFTSYLGVTEISKNGLTAKVNDDGTITISGTNTSTGYTYIIDLGGFGENIYPAGTYTIPSGFMMQVRAAQYPNGVTIPGATGNLFGGTSVTISEPFRIASLRYAVNGGATRDVTLPFGLFRGSSIPETGFKYSGNVYTVEFDAQVYEGEFNWTTGELKDADGNTVAYYDSHDIVSLEGTNYFWTGFGENTVSNRKDVGKVILRLNETAPEETVSSICDFQFRPKTPTAVYFLHDGRVLPNGGVFFGHEIPLITTKGTLAVVDAQSGVVTEKYVDALINHQGVYDILTNKGLHKVWSDKFYFTKEPVAQEDFSYSNGHTNSLYTFEFTEDDFQNVGIPAKLDNIPIVSPCFYTEADAANKLNERVWGGGKSPATLSWDESSQKYIFKVRGYQSGYIMSQLQHYTKGYLYYQLETPYDDTTTFAMGVSSGDKVTFTVDDSDWKAYVDGGLFGSNIADIVNVTPDVSVLVPRSTEDACEGMINAARMLNMDDAEGGDATVQGYSWIGEGDGATDYTAKLQNKLDELHTVTNGGTVYLGPGTYPISGNL